MIRKILLWVLVIFCGFSFSALAQTLSPRIEALRAKTNAFAYANKYDSAQALVLQFLLVRDLSDTEIFYGHYLYGDLLKSSGKPEAAISQLLNSKAFLKGIPNTAKYESMIDGNLAECYFDLMNFTDARKYALLSIETNPDSSLRSDGHAVNYTILGYCAYTMNDYKSALDYYNFAISAYLKAGDVCELPLCYMKMAKTYNKLGNKQLAVDNINKAISISDSCHIENYQLLSKRTLFDIYKDNKDYKQALDLLEEINGLVAKLESSKHSLLMSEVEVRYHNLFMEKENDRLREVNEKNNELVERQREELIITFSALVVVLVFVIFLIRISKKRKQAEQKLSALNVQLEEKIAERTKHLTEANEKIGENAALLTFQNTQLTDFCNIITHNFRSPLSNISTLIGFIEKSDDLNDQKMMLEKLKPVVTNLNETFSELVESLQVKQDLEIKSEKLLVSDILKKTEEGLQGEINESHAVIQADFSEAPTINYPPKYLYSIFQNLLSNALKYRSPNRNPSILLKTKYENGKIILSVSDNGQGIDLSKYGDQIFKIRKVFHEHPDAKGFGLYITKTQVETMGGKIWVASTPGVGSTFFVQFGGQ